mmetsp:Transcript_23553/g.51016  ORF Transcript_23553/g.51016 Transcript_23553/m.51016 type:complete len:96 (-) Transcript_23553:856-1143(-)
MPRPECRTSLFSSSLACQTFVFNLDKRTIISTIIDYRGINDWAATKACVGKYYATTDVAGTGTEGDDAAAEPSRVVRCGAAMVSIQPHRQDPKSN